MDVTVPCLPVCGALTPSLCESSFQTPAPEDPSVHTTFQRLLVTPCACDRTCVDQFYSTGSTCPKASSEFGEGKEEIRGNPFGAALEFSVKPF